MCMSGYQFNDTAESYNSSCVYDSDADDVRWTTITAVCEGL